MQDYARSARRRLRQSLVACSLLVLASANALPAMARNVPNLGFNDARFIGMVTAIQGSSDSPTQISLQLGTLSTDVRVNLKTVFSGKSAEANVEGLLEGDFATVIAHRFRGGWVANRVLFDVQPMMPLHLFTGMVTKETFNGKRVTIRVVGTQRYLTFRIPVEAQFQADGRAVINPLPMSRGNAVQILALHFAPGWVAYTINIKTTGLWWNTAHPR